MTTLLDARGKPITESQAEVHVLEKALAAASGTIYALEERLNGVDRMMDEPGWHQIFQHGHDGGLTLQQIKLISAQLRELIAANPFLKRGSQVRATYVWGGGLDFSAKLASGKPTTLTTQVRDRMAKPRNKRYVFSNTAHEEFERAAATDGNVFLLHDDKGFTFQRVPLEQITADLRNPDNAEEVWMFRRTWSRDPGNGERPERMVRWYYTDIFDGTRKAQVQVEGNGLEPVDKTQTMLHVALNQQVGWAYGVADLLPVIAWVKLYREFLTNGYVMSRALAQIAFKVSAQSVAGAQSMSAQIAMPGQAGRAITSGSGNDVSAVTTAGKGYDFGSGRPLAAAIAAGIEVSVESLLGEQTADTLDITAKASATMRRLNWDDAFDRILACLGNQRDLRVTWHNLPVEQIQRQMQAWTLANAANVFPREVIQAGMARTMNIADPGDVPDPLPAPNTNPNGGTTGAGGSTAGTGQGQDAPTGGSGNNDSKGTD